MLRRRYLFRKNSVFLLSLIIFFPFQLQAFPLFPPTEAQNSFFKALVLLKQGAVSPDNVKSLLRRASISAPEPVRTEARAALLEVLKKEGDTQSVIILGQTFLQSGSSPEKIVPFLAEPLYEQHRYTDLYNLLSSRPPESRELLGYKVLVWGALKVEGWQRVFSSFLAAPPDSSGGGDIFSRIQKEWEKRSLLSELSSGARQLLAFRTYVEHREYRKAAERAVLFLRSEEGLQEGSGLLTGRVIDEIAKTAVRSGRIKDVLNLFVLLVPRAESGTFPRETAAPLLWGAGYLSQRSGRGHAAADFYRRGLACADTAWHDKLLWYWFASEMRISPTESLGHVDFLVENWRDPRYFSDILSELASDLVRNNRWQDLRNLYVHLRGKAGEDILARLSYLAARGAEEGYFRAGDEEIVQWFTESERESRGVASGLYYKIMAHAALQERNGLGGADKRAPDSFRIFVPDSSGKRSPSRSFDVLLKGAIAFNLPEYGKAVIADHPGLVSLSAVRDFTRFLKRRGDYLNSIRIMSRYAAQNSYRVTKEDVETLYPLGYRDIIAAVRAKEHLPVPVFTALVREESQFSPVIVSAAGAVGLSQLMPSTAEDAAGRMGLTLTKVDITSPRINASLGGWYLGNLLGRTDTVLDALFAYNGGLTRVRRWKKRYGALPEDLFLEALPYKETSLYGRKVLVSAVVYGYLYFSKTPVEVIHLFMNKRF